MEIDRSHPCKVIRRFFCGIISILIALNTIGNYGMMSKVKAVEEVYQVRELGERRDEYSTTYLNSDGSYSTKFYSSAIRYREKNGELRDIDTSITELNKDTKIGMSTEYSYKSEATEVDIFLPKEISEEIPIFLKWDRYSVKLTPITKNSADRVIENKKTENEEESEESPVKVESASLSSGTLIEENVEDIYGNTERKNTKLSYKAFSDEKTSKNTNAIELEYQPLADGIKENIVINKDVGIYKFDFWLELEGYIPEMSDYGAIILKDDKTKEDVGVIPVPYVYEGEDENHVNYDVVRYKIKEIEGGYILSVIIDEDYVKDDKRIFPLIIDPTICLQNTTGVKEAYVLSNYPTTNFYSSAVNVMRVGYDTGFYICRTYVWFPTMAAQVQGKVVSDATFYAKVNYTNSGSVVRADRITTYYTFASLTWNKRPTTVDDLDSGTVTMSSGTKTLNLIRYVQGVATGQYPDEGICLRATKESGATFANFYGSRHATASVRPYMYVTYYDACQPERVTLVGGAPNSKKNNVEMVFSSMNTLRYFVLVAPNSNPSSSQITEYEITGEIDWNVNSATWNSENSHIFSNYTSFLDRLQ